MTSVTAYMVLAAVPKPTVPPVLRAGATLPAVGQVYPLGAGKNMIGRYAPPHFIHAAVDLPWAHVSRRHAEIECNGLGGWEIEDLQSRNGTFVNGQRVLPNSRSHLSDGDRIGIGGKPIEVEFVFCLQLAPVVSPPEPCNQNPVDEDAPIPFVASARETSETLDYKP
jgi:predicted component of type VI protein secretion system